MELISYVSVKGANAAFELYKDVFGAEIVGDVTTLDMIDGFTDLKHKGLVGHMTIQIGTSRFFIKDYLEDYPHVEGDHIQFVANFETEAELKSAFAKLSKDGTIIHELQEVFWGALFGSVKDEFGITWQIYTGHK